MAEKVEEYELTEKEQKKIRKMCAEVTAIHKFITTEKIGETFKDNAERFIGINAFHTKALVKHSITLTRWTYALSFFASVQIVVIILIALKIIG